MPYKKPVTYISGLIAGFLLFIALLAVQLNSVIYNAGFQQAAIDKLNIYERFIAAPDLSSAKSGDMPFSTAFKNSITPDLLNKNIKSLIDGLIDFVSGRTHNLPDLYIAGTDKLSIATSAGVTPAAIEKINLQLIMMFSSEQNLNDILSVVSLIQFILAYLPLFCLLLCAAIAAAASRKSPPEILGWMRTSVLTFFILCWVSAWLIGSIPWLILFLRLSWLPESEVIGILSDYIRYCSGSISGDILLSGLTLPVGIRLADYIYGRLNDRVETSSQINSSSDLNFRTTLHKTGILRNRTRSTTIRGCSKAAEARKMRFQVPIMPVKPLSIRFRGRTIPVLLATTTIYSTLAFILVNNTDTLFHKRNLGHAVSYIMGNLSYNRYTDARNEDVCLLNINLLNENDKTPVRNMQAAVCPLDSKSGGKVINDKGAAPEKTDEDGSISFLLSEGEFRLELYSTELSGYEGQTVSAPLSYDLSLSSPGRTDLTVILGSDAGKSSGPEKSSDTGESSDASKSGDTSESSDPEKLSNTVESSDADKSSDPSKSSSSGTTSVPIIPRLKIVDASMQYMP
jgi:hypothetical protein